MDSRLRGNDGFTSRLSFPRLFNIYQVFLTTNHVIGETYTFHRTSKGYQEARRFLDVLRQSPRVEEYFATYQIEK